MRLFEVIHIQKDRKAIPQKTAAAAEKLRGMTLAKVAPKFAKISLCS